MNCPRCQRPSLTTKKYRETAVTVDQCTHCLGIWFDQHELNAVLDLRAIDLNLAVPTAEQRRPACPKCERAMTTFLYPHTTV